MDWNSPAHALAKREPRRGERAILRVLVATPQVGGLRAWVAEVVGGAGVGSYGRQGFCGWLQAM